MGKYKVYHGPRHDKVVTNDTPGVIRWKCPACGKMSFHTRKDAKTFVKKSFQDRRMRYYQCDPRNPGSPWHVTSYSAARAAAYRKFESKGRNVA